MLMVNAASTNKMGSINAINTTIPPFRDRAEQRNVHCFAVLRGEGISNAVVSFMWVLMSYSSQSGS